MKGIEVPRVLILVMFTLLGIVSGLLGAVWMLLGSILVGWGAGGLLTSGQGNLSIALMGIYLTVMSIFFWMSVSEIAIFIWLKG